MKPDPRSRLLRALAPLVKRACAKFYLREPDVLQIVSCHHVGMFGQTERRKHGEGIRMTLCDPADDCMPLYTLAHELAHLGQWPHGAKHDRLTLDILDFWQKEMPTEARAALAACG